ncbi:unnamed protein product [Caenorhabditis bovis]|uniref:Uncharacterized protein n=1 Tax=Caenorhabditis bovis TaxID=2654633 RepID=A0A8S1F260_9PELO|nr:unnamed protein product [Caenorhabditis bovis]
MCVMHVSLNSLSTFCTLSSANPDYCEHYLYTEIDVTVKANNLQSAVVHPGVIIGVDLRPPNSPIRFVTLAIIRSMTPPFIYIFQNRRHMICRWLVAFLATWLIVIVVTSSTENEGEGSGSIVDVDDDRLLSTTVSSMNRDTPPLVNDVDVLRSPTTKTVSKRSTKVFYNGLLDPEFFSPFSYNKPRIPPTAVIPFGRPLQRGNNIPQLQYIALWAPRGQSPHWGIIATNSMGKLDGVFIKDRRIYNLSSTNLQNTNVRLLQYVGSESSNNFRFAWTRAIDVDIATVVSEKKVGLCHPRMAPAILQDQGYEYLGEADIDNRIMFYVEHNYVNTVEGALFTNNVFLLTKQQCQCSCPLNSY